MRIETIDPEDAVGELADAYAKVAGARGKVSEIWKMHSPHPRVILAHLELYTELMFSRSPLSRPDRELIAYAVSIANDCHY